MMMVVNYLVGAAAALALMTGSWTGFFYEIGVYAAN